KRLENKVLPLLLLQLLLKKHVRCSGCNRCRPHPPPKLKFLRSQLSELFCMLLFQFPHRSPDGRGERGEAEEPDRNSTVSLDAL
ncbi:hypothetical protein BKA57DRAFT_455810, partial [Linnemannia elongata]